MNPRPKILVTGATGYVGGRLIPRLLELGFPVVALGRSMTKLLNRPWSHHPLIEVKAVDLFQEEEMLKATQGCKIAYYFIHSMNPDHSDFVASDRRGAEIFTRIAAANQFDRIIYLGGLGEDNPQLSKHLRSRFEVAQILKSGPVPVTDLRAAMIIGSGSASFEILRYLVDRLPIMLTPKWVETPSQPIAIRDVLSYLLGVLEKEETIGETYDIGGADVITYRELMSIYAEEAHLAKRIIIPVPVFSPKLSSHWIHLITPLSSSIARPLAEGLKNPVVCLDKRIRDIIPIHPISCREAIRLALIRMEERKVETHWSDAGYLPPPEKIYAGDPRWAGGTAYKDIRYIKLNSPAEALWLPITSIGGKTGWYYGNWLWRLRGLLDVFFGGIGIRRGRRHPTEIHPGDALDFWRVLQVEEGTKLILLAEMKVPGEAYLQFEVSELPNQQSLLTQTATFVPRGLLGILYWILVTPLHHFVFNGMLKGIANAAKIEILEGPVKMGKK